MPSPTVDGVHINRLVTNLSVAAVQSNTKFVALQAFPGANVRHKSDNYAVYNAADLLRDEMEERAPSSESAGGGYSVDLSPEYNCKRYAFHYDVDKDTRDNADDPLSPDQDAAIFLAQKYLIKLEVLFATGFFAASKWTGGTKAAGTSGDLVAGTDFTAWSDVSSRPLEDVAEQGAEIESKTGEWPNILVINRVVWNALKNHPDVVDRIKHTSAEPVQRRIVASLMELEDILVGAAIRNTAAKGLTASYDYIFGNHALLAYRTASPTTRKQTAGVTFRWTGLEGSVDGMTVTTLPAPLIKSTRHEIETNVDMKVVSANCGAFFQNAA